MKQKFVAMLEIVHFSRQLMDVHIMIPVDIVHIIPIEQFRIVRVRIHGM